MAVDSNGLPIYFRMTGGEVHDRKEAPDLIAELPQADYIIADRGYDSKDLRSLIKKKERLLLFQEKRIQLWEMVISIGVCINIATSLKTFLQDLNISEQLPHDMAN